MWWTNRRAKSREAADAKAAEAQAEAAAEAQAEAEAQLAGTSQLGAETFLGACSKCHGMEGEGDVGPRLAGNQLLDDAEAVEQVVRNGRGEMPPIGKSFTERQMKALTDYLEEELLGGQR